jgi:hypothetical protein
MSTPSKPTSRKKFLWWGSALIAGVAAVKWLPFYKAPRPVAQARTKMLTQDGTLVEIDESLLTRSGKKITNGELQQWIKKDQPKQTGHGQH